jgi:hypothetical protein
MSLVEAVAGFKVFAGPFPDFVKAFRHVFGKDGIGIVSLVGEEKVLVECASPDLVVYGCFILEKNCTVHRVESAERKFCIDVNILKNVLERADKGMIEILFSNNDDKILKINVFKGVVGGNKEFEFKIEGDAPKIPEVSKIPYKASLICHSAEFYSAINDAMVVSDAVHLETVKNGLHVSAADGYEGMTYETIIRGWNVEGSAKASFSTHYLSTIAYALQNISNDIPKSKNTPTPPDIYVYFSNNAPLKVAKSVVGGEIFFVLAPRVE